MNQLAVDKKYDELIELFVNQMANYTQLNTERRKQEIPENHINLVVEALYFTVNRVFNRSILQLTTSIQKLKLEKCRIIRAAQKPV